MTNIRYIAATFGLLLASGPFVRAQEPQIQTSQNLNDQWFTGPLVAPSPALSKAGQFVLEPYLSATLDTGRYSANGHQAGGSNQSRTFALFSLFEYGITDRLTIEVVPQINYAWNDTTTSRGIVASDTPVDFKYRFVDQVVNTAIPSASVSLGIDFPSGPYDTLGSPLEEIGTGVYYARQGAVLQWLFNTYGDHPLRIRLWGSAQEPLNDPTISDLSVYGTSAGFHGKAKAGMTATGGISPEYALNQRWVLAADIVRSYTGGSSVLGADAGAVFADREGSKANWSFAPAVEYNWSPRYGIIGGVQFSFAGHNTSSYVTPQLAVNIVF